MLETCKSEAAFDTFDESLHLLEGINSHPFADLVLELVVERRPGCLHDSLYVCFVADSARDQLTVLLEQEVKRGQNVRGYFGLQQSLQYSVNATQLESVLFGPLSVDLLFSCLFFIVICILLRAFNLGVPVSIESGLLALLCQHLLQAIKHPQFSDLTVDRVHLCSPKLRYAAVDL